MSKDSCSGQSQSGPAQIDWRLLDLLRYLCVPPRSLSDHSWIYPFESFERSPYDIEHYGSKLRPLSHRLDLIFGSRSGVRLIEYRGRGPFSEAIADIPALSYWL